jgi:hypothetical protein
VQTNLGQALKERCHKLVNREQTARLELMRAEVLEGFLEQIPKCANLKRRKRAPLALNNIS